MSTASPSTLPSGDPQAAAPVASIWRWSVDQYHEMIRVGILTEDDPVELLEGSLVTKMPKNRHHTLVTQLTREALAQTIPSGWYVDAQEPVTTANSEPEPDVIVVRGDRRQYPDRHPGPQDVALVVEVADSSPARDRSTKKRVYAAAEIPVYWLVNLAKRQIEVYTDPAGPAVEPDYSQRQDYVAADALPVMLEGREIDRIDVR
ncbi:MAG: Uma2 family endonuclease, partial [bacterium]|nr:Uma2 family endonuclease [bacterium]